MAQYGTGGCPDPGQDTGRPRLRFETLDSWRGICAILVAMMHFPVSGWLAETSIVRGGYLFVDYFFVLSGAVIAHGYGDRIADGAGYLRFIALRLGRIYPLHVAVLLLFVAFEALRLAVPALHGDGAAPFTEGNTVDTLLSSLLMLNGVGVEKQLVWNGPSWSISSEFWTYVLFGGVVLALRKRVWLALAAAVVVCPILLALGSTTHFMDTTYDFGLVRCIYGFSLGALLYAFFRRGAMRPSGAAGQSAVLWTCLELGTVIMVGVFVSLAARNAWSFAAPFVFGAALLVFMHERGAVSRLLRMRFFLWLGTLSYGIYMFHIFVQSRMINAGTLFGKLTGVELIRPFDLAGQHFYGFGVESPAFALAIMLAMLGAVVAAAWLGRVLVEMPFMRMTKRWVDARSAQRIVYRRRYAAIVPGGTAGADGGFRTILAASSGSVPAEFFRADASGLDRFSK